MRSRGLSLAAFAVVVAWSDPTAAAPPPARELGPSAAPVEQYAEAHGLRGLEREPSSWRPRADGLGEFQRSSLRLHGLRISGAFETRWRDGQRVRTLATLYPRAAPRRAPHEARVGAEHARALVLPSWRVGQWSRPVEAELVYLLHLGTPILAWELTPALSLAAPQPSRERVWISASSGRELDRVELVDAINETRVYLENPVRTPEPEETQLQGIEGGPGVPLHGERVAIFNCVDEEQAETSPWWEEGECHPATLVVGDENGQYYVDVPDPQFLEQNIDPTDLYAEVSAYHHSERFLDFMQTRGLDDFLCEQTWGLANFHYVEPAPLYPDHDFGPFNNAFFTSECDPEQGPAMVLGQGSEVDFAFDGDVVYHELGHGVVRHLNSDGLRKWNLREDGVLRDARALNEAVADYHTIMVTEDPALAEYVGFYWPAFEEPWIRHAENDNWCPRFAHGQEHRDSEAVTAALWAAREILGEGLDLVLLDAIPLMAPDVTIEEGSAAFLTVADERVEAGLWSAEHRDRLESALVARGLLDCPRMVQALEPDGELTWYLRRKSGSIEPFWPGPAQLHHVVPSGSDNAILRYRVDPRGNSAGQPAPEDTAMSVLVKHGPDSIRYSYEVEDDVTHASGDWEFEVEPTQLGPFEREVVIRGLGPGDELTFAMVNRSTEGQLVASEIFATSVPSEDLDHGSPWVDPEPEGGTGGAGADESSAQAGCACDTSPSSPSPAAPLILFAGVWAWRRFGAS